MICWVCKGTGIEQINPNDYPAVSAFCDCPVGRKRSRKLNGGNMRNKKKKNPRTKNANTKGPGNEPFKARAITTSKASRGFTTKKPPKVHLSYPL